MSTDTRQVRDNNGQPPQVQIQVEDDRTGLSVETLRRAFTDHLTYLQGKDEYTATSRDRYFALAAVVRDRMIQRWIKTQQTYYKQGVKRVYYLSAEFLVGRSLGNNLINSGLYDKTRQALADIGVDLEEVLEGEVDAGLGNGGLGRLAACFLDSMATLELPGYGYGIRYEFGIFDQQIRNGYQVERPDEWLKFGNAWEIARPEYAFTVKFGGHTEHQPDGKGGFRVGWVGGEDVMGIPYDTPVSGFANNTVNTMRLWRARAGEEFDLQVFNEGDYERAVMEKNASENISKVLYPSDSTEQGKELRLKQQYFFVSCSLQDIVRRHLSTHKTFDNFADKVAIQMNDTHPSVAVAELMRLLMDGHGLSWEKAWEITSNTCAYTNHTVLAEALERWPVALFERLLPRHLEIIYEVNYRFLREVMNRYPLDQDRLRRMSIVEEGPVRRIRMAHLAIVGGHKVNGVAALHTDILKRELFKDFYELWPEKFQNKTNGVTPRRWMVLANPGLTGLISEAIGPQWMKNLDELRKLERFADDPAFRAKFRQVKHQNKVELAKIVTRTNGVTLDPNSLYDVQIKRLHEYKRQLLNILHIVALYNRLKGRGPADAATSVPRSFLFGAKAAPGYATAKLIIKLINNIGEVVNNDRDVADKLKVVFVPNYSVSLAQRIVPAADISEQISTAGLEASGTGNMKLSLNGALTIGTLDGANVEIREEVGDENFFLFGLTTPEVGEKRTHGYRPRDHYENEPELRAVIDLIGNGFFSPEQPKLFQPLIDSLLNVDHYLLLADFASYVTAQQRVSDTYKDPEKWSKMAILNVARLGKFSSDRSIREYAEQIWNAKPVKIEIDAYVQK